jgi:flagellar hook-length control protein FliK
MDHPGQTEIRIEMQSESLGGVELRAHISGNQIGASIAVEHHDAQVLLANDLPALHNALVEKNLRIDSLSVSHGMPSSTAGGPGSDASHRGFSQSNPKAVYARLDEAPVPVSEPPLEYLGSTHVNARLSVLA